MYITRSTTHGGTQAAQPNNTYLVINNDYCCSRTKALLYCCSNSTSYAAGSFTFSNGGTYSNDVYYMDIDNLSGDYNGCIRLEVESSSSSSSRYLSSSYEGIYTCNIPDAAGRTQYVNFGLFDESTNYRRKLKIT